MLVVRAACAHRLANVSAGGECATRILLLFDLAKGAAGTVHCGFMFFVQCD